MPPSLHPPAPQSHKLKRRHHPAAMAKRGLAAILYKLRDVHRSPPSPSTPSATHHYSQRCYPPPPSAWPWPSCRHPRTSSFRARPDEHNNAAAAVFRTVNTVYDTSFVRRRSSMDEDASRVVDPRSPALPAAAAAEAEKQQAGDDEDKETTAVVRGVRSDRLFFEPAGAEFLPPKHQVTHCACLPLSDGKAPPVESAPAPARGEEEAADAVSSVESDEPAAATAAAAPSDKDDAANAVKGGAVVVTVESKDPYGDFRASMAEMVAAHGLRDWEALEELLAWYLKLNAKGVHAAIVGAFIDLLVSMQASPPPPLPASPTTHPSPSPSSSCITFEEYSSATFDDEDKS
ncbi:hypothetical protein EJB05_52754, partial [Eragrostis curvula]